MSFIYFPSCKFTAYAPEASKRIAIYLKERFNMEIAGCCRPGIKSLTSDHTAVCVCNTCSAICSESSNADNVISLWEILSNDDKFSFPDYHHEKMAVQDCWRAYDNRKKQDAVRKLLKRMNIDVIELKDNYEKTRFCGTSVLIPLIKENGELAPNRFIKNAQGMFIPHTKEEQLKLMTAHCTKIPTNKVVCYCVPCANGLALGGKQAMHLLNLLFSIGV